MDFLEDLFDIGDRKHRNKGGIFQNGDHHDNDHHSDDDHHDNHDHHQSSHNNSYPQSSFNSPIPGNQPVQFNPPLNSNTTDTFSSTLCRKCSTQTVQVAKFCHACGSATDSMLIIASCGSQLPVNAIFCA